MTEAIAISSITMFTPFGNAEQTVAASNAGLSAYAESPFQNRNNNPIKMCLVPDDALPPLSEEYSALILNSRRERIIRLATAALAEFVENTNLPGKVPLLFTAPEKLPGKRTPIDDRYLQLIAKPFEDVIDIENSYIFPYGRASIVAALQSAKDLLHSGHARYVIVGGADSYCDSYYLEELDMEGRLLAEGELDAFAPGEASAFMLLSLHSNDPSAHPVEVQGVIQSWGAQIEPGHRYSEEPYLGEGLAAAVKQALVSYPEKTINTLYANLNGEGFMAKEWGLARLRNSSRLADEVEISHPADCFGDLGAAFGPVMLGYSALNMGSDIQLSPGVICCSSELESRAAIVVEKVIGSGK